MIALCPYIAYRRILMIKVLMHGCNGKMGQVVSRMVDETEGMELAAGVWTDSLEERIHIRYLKAWKRVMCR